MVSIDTCIPSSQNRSTSAVCDRPAAAVESDRREKQMGLRGAEKRQLTTCRYVAWPRAHLPAAFRRMPLRHARRPRRPGCTASTGSTPTQTVTVEPPSVRVALPFLPVAATAAGALEDFDAPLVAGIAHRRRQRARQPTLAAPEHPSRPAPTPAPPDRALNPAPYHNLGARRAQPTQAPHSTGSDRPQPQHEAPRPPNGPNPLKKDHFFCARGMNQRVGRGRQFLQYCTAVYCTAVPSHAPRSATA